LRVINKDIVIFIGPPGSGKGSLSQLCVKRLGWIQLSTGNICRQHIAEQTEIGKQIDFAIKSGKLISDSLIIAMVKEWLLGQFIRPCVVILDGFPRTVAQAAALTELLQSPELSDVRLTIFKMTIPDTYLIQRLSARLICNNNQCQTVYSLDPESLLEPRELMVCNDCSSILIRRLDDEEDAIRERLLIYHKHEQKLVEFYKSIGQPVISLDVHLPLEDVYVKLVNSVDIEFT
jgi:adenylate kinase